MNPQKYFKKMGIIVWNAGKNGHILFNKAAIQSLSEELRSQFLFI